MPRAPNGIDVDAVDLPGERATVAEIEAALQLLCRALVAERDFEAARHERKLAHTLLVHDRFEVAPQRRVELARLHVGHLHALSLRAPRRGTRA